MRHSKDNLEVIKNFILYLTHCGDHGLDSGYNMQQTWTPKLLYDMANRYIQEDHIDGEENEDDIFLYRFVCHFNDIVNQTSKPFQNWYNRLAWYEKQEVIMHYKKDFENGLSHGLCDPTSEVVKILAYQMDEDFNEHKKILG